MLYVLIGVATVLVLYLYLATTVADRPRAVEAGAGAGPGPARDPKAGRAAAVAGERPARFCPICSSEMGPFDKLYGEIYKAEPRDKVFIKGCPRCVALPGLPSSRPDHAGSLDL